MEIVKTIGIFFRTATDGKRNFFLIPLAILLAAIIIGAGLIYRNYAAKKTLINIEFDDKEQSPEIGSTAPLFALSAPSGSKIELKDLRGKNVLLVFWSTQCDYCKNELEELKKFADTYRGQIVVLAVNYMETPHSVSVYEKEQQINFPVVIDANGSIFSKYKIDGTPYHFLIDKDGKIAVIFPNATNFFGLQALLKNLPQ